MGVMTFGGGMAMLPILQREVVDNKHWATEEELVDYFCHRAVYAGHHRGEHGYVHRTEVRRDRRRHCGDAGRGVPVPGHHLHPGGADHQLFRSCVGAERLCRHPGVRVRADFQCRLKAAEKSVVDKRTAVIFVVVLLGGIFLDLSPVWFVIGAALAGIVLKNWEVRKA